MKPGIYIPYLKHRVNNFKLFSLWGRHIQNIDMLVVEEKEKRKKYEPLRVRVGGTLVVQPL